MENRELISSVKGIVSRLNSLGLDKDEARELFVLLFLLRCLQDDISGYLEYRTDSERSKISYRIKDLFSFKIDHENIEGLLFDIFDRIKTSSNLGALNNFDFTSKQHLIKNKSAMLCAIEWLSNWRGGTFERMHEVSQLFEIALNETKTARISQFSSSKSLSQLVVAIAQPKSGEKILDLCTGEGNFLFESYQVIEKSGNDFLSQTTFQGFDVNENALLVASVRFLLTGATNFKLLRRSALHEGDYYESRQKFDVVFAHPPVGIMREDYRHLAYDRNFPVSSKDAGGLFIQQALNCLKDNGRAIVALPEGVLFNQNKVDIELRRFLVEQGYLEGVIRIPQKVLIEESSIRGVILILNKSKKSRKIRFVDLITFFAQTSTKVSQILSGPILRQIIDIMYSEKLPEKIVGIKDDAVGSGTLAHAFWDVTTEHVADNNWDLNPQRIIDDSLSALLFDFKSQLGHEVVVENLSRVCQITIGRPIKATDQSNVQNSFGYIRIRDIENFKVNKISSWVNEDVAFSQSQYQLLEGNVLLSKTGTIGKLALIDSVSEGTFAGNNFYVLKANTAKILPEYLLSYLATQFCQEWLDKRKRGAVQQHINTDVIKSLPVLVPSIELQKKAVSQFRETGTDVITFLKENSRQTEVDGIENMLVTMESYLPSMVGSDYDIESTTNQLSDFSKSALDSKGAIKYLKSERKDWYRLVWLILNDSKYLNRMPPGPVLLNSLKEIGGLVSQLTSSILGNYFQEERLIKIFSYFGAKIDRVVWKILHNVKLNIFPELDQLEADSQVEFKVTLQNQSYLPLKNVVVETFPEFGKGESFYLADNSQMEVTLTCKTSLKDDNFVFKVLWRAETLAGEQVSGSSEIAIKLAKEHVKFNDFEKASNPYVTGSPLEPQNGAMVFYGRDALLQQIVRQVEQKGNVILLEGNRRAGKTSILKHLEGNETIANWLVVYSSLQGAEGASDAVGVPTAEVFREMARSIASAITKLKIDVPLPDGKVIVAGKPALGIARACRAGISEDSPFIDFREYLEVLLLLLEPKGLGIVLMLDEFDKLQEGIDNGVTSPQLPENIRYLIQNYSKFSAILTGSRRLKRLREEYWSALYGLGTSLTVTSLDKDSAEKVIKKPVMEYLAYSNEGVDFILYLTAKQPYLIQKVCNRIFDYAVKNDIHSIKTNDIAFVAEELVKSDEHFASLWDYSALGPINGGYRRQALLCILANNIDNVVLCTFGMLQEELAQKGIKTLDEELEEDITYLRELELINFRGELGVGYYSMEVPLMAMWIQVHEDEEIIFKNAMNIEGAKGV